MSGAAVPVPPGGPLAGLATFRDARSARCSSWDQSGRNQDAWMVAPGEAITLADLEGPGCLTHIWMTQSCRRFAADRLVADPDYYRKVLLRITWDDQPHPGVLVPLGDFFCLGHSIASPFASLPLTVSVNPDQRHRFGGAAALNCYFPMPFRTRALVELVNENDVPHRQFFYIDYELYRRALAADTLRLPRQLAARLPCAGWEPASRSTPPRPASPTWRRPPARITSSWRRRGGATTSAATSR